MSQNQENLSLEKLITLNSPNLDQTIVEKRPVHSFVELMDWTQNHFSIYLKDKQVHKYVHNRVIIDGQFYQYCQENKISIQCLYKDSIISWENEGYEKFFVQGVFLIKARGLEFIHSALFHKGNQNEDEISFFCLVSNDNYDKYIELRNKFDVWVSKKDRSNQKIRVIDGEDISYSKDYTWEDLFLDEDKKVKIKNLVENFLKSKDFYVANKIPWKRGVFLYGPPGCGKSSIIKTIISLYDFKPITVTANANGEIINEAFSYAEEQSPSLLYFEDLDSMLERNLDVSTFLNLMDGISAKNGLLVIATANEIRKLKSNIIDRPSRFDMKMEIMAPSKEMSHSYLKKWFGKTLTEAKYKELGKISEKYNLSYAYLKELYISSMFQALSNNRKILSMKDIDIALDCLLKDKNIVGNKTVDMDRYFK